MFVSNRKLNKKLNLLLQRQSLMMSIILQTHLSYGGCKKIEKQWNALWDEIMEAKNG